MSNSRIDSSITLLNGLSQLRAATVATVVAQELLFVQLHMDRHEKIQSLKGPTGSSFVHNSPRLSLLPSKQAKEARLLCLVLRSIYFRTIGFSLRFLKSVPKKFTHKLKVIQRLQDAHKRIAFTDLRMHCQKRAEEESRKNIEQVKPRRIACLFISRKYYTKMRDSFGKMKGLVALTRRKEQSLCCLRGFLGSFAVRKWGRQLFGKMHPNGRQSFNLNLIKFANLFNQISGLLNRKAAADLFIAFEKAENNELVAQSQEKKKEVQLFENNRSRAMADSRQSLQKLKKEIDQLAVQKYQVMSGKKRAKALRMGEERTRIRELKQQTEELEVLLRRNTKTASRLSQVNQDRRALAAESQKGNGRECKVNQLYLSLDRECAPPLEILKEKFKVLISPASNPEVTVLKQGIAYNVAENAKRKSMLAIYENVSMELPKRSQRYERASDENESLKQLVGAVMKLELLSAGGDEELRGDVGDLERQVQELLELEMGEREREELMLDSGEWIGIQGNMWPVVERRNFRNASTIMSPVVEKRSFRNASTMSITR